MHSRLLEFIELLIMVAILEMEQDGLDGFGLRAQEDTIPTIHSTAFLVDLLIRDRHQRE